MTLSYVAVGFQKVLAVYDMTKEETLGYAGSVWLTEALNSVPHRGWARWKSQSLHENTLGVEKEKYWFEGRQYWLVWKAVERTMVFEQ